VDVDIKEINKKEFVVKAHTEKRVTFLSPEI